MESESEKPLFSKEGYESVYHADQNVQKIVTILVNGLGI